MARYSSLDKIKMIRSGMGNPSTGDVPDTEVAQYLNLSEKDLAERYEIPSLHGSEAVSVIADQSDYELTSTNVLCLMRIVPATSDSVPLKLRDDDWDRKTGMWISSGAPAFLIEQGVGANNRKQVRLRPTPSSAGTVTVYFVKEPTMPDHENATISDLPSGFDLAVVARAIEIGLELTGERSEALKQGKLTPKAEYSAERSLPGAGFNVSKFSSFASRIQRGRRRR